MRSELAKKLYASDIARMCGGRLTGENKLITSVATDSRETDAGTLFAAIKGERMDGHDYISKAAETGLGCALVSKQPQDSEVSYITVDDTVEALGRLASEYRKLFDMKVVGVTGSVGKTSTKEMVYDVLSERFRTVRTEGNHNNNIGLPMTLLNIPEDTEAAVIEMGMSGFGEISYLSKIASPDVALITNIGSSHIEKLGSREGIAKAKLEIKEGLKKGGRLILNGGEPLLAGEDALYVGRSDNCGVRITSSSSDGEKNTFTLEGEGVSGEYMIPVLGEHNVFNAAMAAAAGHTLGLGKEEIARGIAKYRTTGMRQKITEWGSRTFLEDCYNASPESMAASVRVLAEVAKKRSKRAVAVLGNMLELGAYSPEGHRRTGQSAAEAGIDMLVTFGSDALYIAKGAADAGMDPGRIFSFYDTADVSKIGDFLINETGGGDVVLFKASRGIKLERVMEYIKTTENEG